ncbi:low molecular weight protein-tyrosine-phosphatase [Pararobbsia silviterrae]|uniref:protein-tyrosine-phosphatase n=1 Tax=Pararobbsia silviterrae TaxID=1792498 RepID=A0A494XIB0_9BURK|nr:low molecular weight protein-tyrosine-phosphatase [Pararobbsia silviterrae]RKP50288.1 low molecular weight phosphotyrosine protein phosphatase [Pararobbsia silviterrae]
MQSVLFVCLGNICRSPTAEAVMLHLVEQAGLQDRIVVDSAGTGDWHIGEAPDSRARAYGARRGYDLEPLRARQVAASDFERFDHILAMDAANLRELRRQCPVALQGKVQLLMDFAPGESGSEIADPYFGGAEGFERVLDDCETACAGLLDALRTRE